MRARAVAVAALIAAGCAVASPPFPISPEPGTVFRELRAPAGTGPFPAVVLLHTCAGVYPHVFTWADWFRDHGYAAVVLDSFTPRGVRAVCGNWSVRIDQVAGDAVAALDALRRRPDIDGNRIAVIGFSYGASAALRVASPRYHGAAPGFRAAVSVYPVCVSPRSDWPADAQERSTNLYGDVDTPLLVLMGEADTDTPNVAANCATAVEQLRRAGRSVDIKLYPGAWHAFDQPGRWYHAEATRDAMATSLQFFDQHLRARTAAPR